MQHVIGSVVEQDIIVQENDEACYLVTKKENACLVLGNETATAERTMHLNIENYYKVCLSTLPACSTIVPLEKGATDMHEDT